MIQPLDGPSSQDIKIVTATIVVEVKITATPLEERKVISLQPDGKIRVFFGDGTVPTVSDVLTKGFIHYKNVIRSYEATYSQDVYMISDTGASVNVIVAERA